MRDVVVIGGGLNGLVAATWLARQKLTVTLVDQREDVGGGAITADIGPGVRGPALSHAFGPIHLDVVRALKLHQAEIETIMPDPALTTLGKDGWSLVFHRDPVLTAASIHGMSPLDAGRWRKFLDTSQRIALVVGAIQRRMPPAIDGAPLGEWWPFLSTGLKARGLGKRDLTQLARWVTMPVADIVAEWFESDLLRASIAARATFGNFAGPRSAGTGWMLLQRLAEDPIPVGSGVTVRGGPGALTRRLAELARNAGAEVRAGIPVSQVLLQDRRATGIELADGHRIDARVVLAAIDPANTFLQLVDAAAVPPTYLERMRNIRARGVLAKINLALSDLPVLARLEGDPAPLRGRLLLARDINHLERAFDAAKYGTISTDPWIEMCLPTVIDQSLAPNGGHMMSIYAHCAPRDLRGMPADEARETLVRNVMSTIDPYMPGLSRLVIARQVLLPEDLERNWGFRGGHIFHGEPTLDQSWIARPQLGWSQYRTPVDGLFLASAGTHPGGGLTGLSGLLAAKTAGGYLRKRK